MQEGEEGIQGERVLLWKPDVCCYCLFGCFLVGSVSHDSIVLVFFASLCKQCVIAIMFLLLSVHSTFSYCWLHLTKGVQMIPWRTKRLLGVSAFLLLASKKVDALLSQVVLELLILLQVLYLVQAKLELSHAENCLHLVLLSSTTLNILFNDFSFLIQDRINFELLCFVQFLVVLVWQDVLQVLVYLGLCYVVEDILDWLLVMVYHKQITFILLSPSLKQHT